MSSDVGDGVSVAVGGIGIGVLPMLDVYPHAIGQRCWATIS